MSLEKENLPIDQQPDETGGTITYANEVIAIISGIAANEVEGIAGMCTSGGFGDIIGRSRNVTRGVKAEVGTEEVSIDLYTIIEYGQPIQKVASEVQENVRKSIEAMTGLKVVRVDVHVQGVSFEQEKRETQTNLEAVKRQHLPDSHQEKAKEDKKADRKKTKEAANDKPAADEAVQDTKQDQPAVADDSVTNEQPEQMVPADEPTAESAEVEKTSPLDVTDPAEKEEPVDAVADEEAEDKKSAAKPAGRSRKAKA